MVGDGRGPLGGIAGPVGRRETLPCSDVVLDGIVVGDPRDVPTAERHLTVLTRRDVRVRCARMQLRGRYIAVALDDSDLRQPERVQIAVVGTDVHDTVGNRW